MFFCSKAISLTLTELKGLTLQFEPYIKQRLADIKTAHAHPNEKALLACALVLACSRGFPYFKYHHEYARQYYTFLLTSLLTSTASVTLATMLMRLEPPAGTFRLRRVLSQT